MEKVLSKKEFRLLTELGNILLKYDAVVQCGESGNIEILVFNPPSEPEATPLPVEFRTCMDETDIRALLERNDRAVKALGIEPEC